MNMRNKHDRDPEWDKVSSPTQEEIIAFNREENRISFLEQQIGAAQRLDGYVLEGYREELKRLKEKSKC